MRRRCLRRSQRGSIAISYLRCRVITRFTFRAWHLLACSLAVLLCGCDQCIVYSVTFQGIGHLGTSSPDSSAAWGASADGSEVVGCAADKHASFAPGATGVVWASPGFTTNWRPAPSTGLEALLLCAEAALKNPVRGMGRAMTPDGNAALGSVSCGGIERPAQWTFNSINLLPFPSATTPAVSGEARCATNLDPFPSAIVGFSSTSTTPDDDHAPALATAWTDDKSGSGLKSAYIQPVSGLTSSRANSISDTKGFGGIVAGCSYDESAGRSSSSVPCGWWFHNTLLGGGTMPWKGDWVPLSLLDDTGAPATGEATAAAADGKTIYGVIRENSTVRPCMWTLTSLPPTSSLNATYLPVLPGAGPTYITSTGSDGTLTVGYCVQPSGPVAIAYIGNKPTRIQQAFNFAFPGIVPSGWSLQVATAVSQNGDDKFKTPGTTLFSWGIVGRGVHNGVKEGWVLRVARVKLNWIECVPQLFPTWLVPKPKYWKKWPELFPPGPLR